MRSSTSKNERSPNANSTLNTLGYSPTPLREYLAIIETIVTKSPKQRKARKPFIVSVTGTSEEIVQCHQLISELAAKLPIPLLMEVNLSCPNIQDKPPPAYSGLVLQEYLFALQRALIDRDEKLPTVAIGVKIPPYTYHDQFQTLIDALLATSGDGLQCPVHFITATNTLGGCLVLAESEEAMAPESDPTHYIPALNSASGTGIGGVGGAMLHPLALGNVRTVRSMLDKEEELRHIDIIGTGGVNDYAAYARMKSCGAVSIGIGTALGREGVEVFEKILNEIETLSKFNKMARNGVKGEAAENN